MKYLLILIVLAMIYYVFIRQNKTSKTKNFKAEAEEMSLCSHCGIYHQTQNMFSEKNNLFCSKECLNAHKNKEKEK